MAGQASGKSTSSVMNEISSIREKGGVTASETSAIGGAGRKGGAAEGPEVAPHKNICSDFLGRMGGNATTGTTGYDSGYGHTT